MVPFMVNHKYESVTAKLQHTFYRYVTRIVCNLIVEGVAGVNALQLVLEDLPIDSEERLRAVVDTLLNQFLPQLADQSCLDWHELQMALAIDIAFLAGAVLEPISALQLSAMLTEAVNAGATCEHDTRLTDDSVTTNDVTPLH